MAADDGPRETMLRDMRYERIVRSLMYRIVYKGVIRFLISPTRDRRILIQCREEIEAERDNTSHPQQRENFQHEIRALDAFERSLNALPVAGVHLTPVTHSHPLTIEGVRISVQPTAYVRQTRPRGAPLAGAFLIDLAKGTELKTDEAKAKAAKGLAHSAALLHKHVSEMPRGDDSKASTEHCILFHAHRQEITKCPENTRAMLRNVEAVCRNIARSWDGIKPPPSFDSERAVSRTWH